MEKRGDFNNVRPIGRQYRGTKVPRYFFSTGTVGTMEKKYRYRSAGTFISQFLGGTRYFCKIFYSRPMIKKSLS